MKQVLETKTDPQSAGSGADHLTSWREAGAALGRAHVAIRSAGPKTQRATNRRRLVEKLIAHEAANPEGENAASVLDNYRLLFGAEKDGRGLVQRLRRYPLIADSNGAVARRVCAVARAYLDQSGDCYGEPEFAAFVEGYQDTGSLTMREIWALRQALMLELLDRLLQERRAAWPGLFASLRRISDSLWKDFFEQVCRVHRVLALDPAGAYSRMDYESRDRYREALAELAKYSPLTETEIAEAIIEFCEDAFEASDGSRAALRRTHVGFYLIDRGRSRLESVIDYRPPLAERIRQFIQRHPAKFYLAGIEVLTLSIVFAILYKMDVVAPALIGLLLLLLPASQAAVDFMNNLVSFLIRPRVLPKLDFSEGIPRDCSTMVVVPALLLNESQVHDLVLDLEIRFLANRDRNLHFALLTDPPDSDRLQNQDDELIALSARLIEGLNQRYRAEGRSPFFLFHRHHTYNESEGCWMGWERKRGKLLDFNKLLRGAYDAFPVKVGDMSVLRRVRYVITLDSDTQLPRDAAVALVGAIAHPLNQAVVDRQTRMVVEGYGILQPRMAISVQSASRSRLAALYSGQTGFDVYTLATSDVYQDLFGEGIFAGKGIYEVDVMRQVLEHRFPENTLLSHDLIEGVYARAALVTDVQLVDDYPSHFSAYSRRRHRWLRGDWQILRWIRSRVPDFWGRSIPNPIPLISRWKIIDNLRRSLLEPGLVLLLLAGWFWLPGQPGYWTAAALLLWFVPVLSGLFFALARIPDTRREMPAWVCEFLRNLRDNAVVTLCSLIFLLHQALIAVDAIARAISRVCVTKKKLLEWETAAEAETTARSQSTVDVYLEWTPWIAAGLAVIIALARPHALPASLPLLTLWIGSREFSHWLNRRPRAGHSKLRQDDVQLLRESADRVWRFFHDWSSSSANWLIPDSVSENGAVELKVSPTNLGMLLNARIAGVHLGVTPLGEFVFETRQTLERVLALPKHRGHLLNWYDINSLEPIGPKFVSTVDSGNLAASLWTLKQASLAFAAESVVKRGVTRDLATELRGIADTCDRLVREMDFRFLYQARKRAFSIGYDLDKNRLHPATYDLLASEARIATFIAIAKGDIPQEAWFRLGRSHAAVRNDRVLLSWSGTMFEYLMPALWMNYYPDTILDRSMKSAVRCQREYARRKGVPWGISESAFLEGANGEWGYAAFGVPELAIERKNPRALVVSPYSTFLGAGVDPAAAVENLRQMQEFGWYGRYGFYEAIDYTEAGGEAVRIWMAHHQGMSLLSIVNLLFDNAIRQYFHAEPQVLATELVLHERVQPGALLEADVVRVPQPEAAAA